jgi:hypothetical protein
MHKVYCGLVGGQMRFTAVLAVVSLAVFAAVGVSAQPAEAAFRAGDTFTVSLQVDSVSSTTGGSSGNSHDIWTLSERVVALRDDGAELEFNLPADASADDRRMAWQFPARIFQPSHGAAQLLNWNEAEPRLRGWLGSHYPAVCGHWFFSWTAQKIDCTAESVIQSVAPYVQPSGIVVGQIYREPNAIAEAHLMPDAGHTLVARLNVDPGIVLRQRAERDVAVAEMTGRSVTLDDALRARSSERVSGTITVTFDFDDLGRITRRQRVTVTEVTTSDGSVEREESTEITRWNRLPR